MLCESSMKVTLSERKPEAIASLGYLYSVWGEEVSLTGSCLIGLREPPRQCSRMDISCDEFHTISQSKLVAIPANGEYGGSLSPHRLRQRFKAILDLGRPSLKEQLSAPLASSSSRRGYRLDGSIMNSQLRVILRTLISFKIWKYSSLSTNSV